jgi:signal transduction histidine kinase
VFDMTERKKMERERAEHALRLAEMSRNLVAVQEEERRRLAGLLHDRTSPNLAAIQINLGIVASGLEGDLPEELDARLDDTLALLEDTTFGIREICTELRPALLDYAGLGAALESFAQNFARRTGVAVHVDVDPCARLAADVESTLFRIVQEAVTNCAKHAEARTLEIKLAAADGATVLTIADDGVGFDPGELGREGKAPGLGLLTMRERAEFAGGRFSIQSRPGGGALVRVEIGRRDPECVGAEA